jgi:hypothetical protein
MVGLIGYTVPCNKRERMHAEKAFEKRKKEHAEKSYEDEIKAEEEPNQSAKTTTGIRR